MKFSTSAYYLDESFIYNFRLTSKFVITLELDSNIVEMIFEKDSSFNKSSTFESIVLSVSNHSKDEFIILEECMCSKSYNLDSFLKRKHLLKKIKEDLNNSFCNWNSFYEKSLEKFNYNTQNDLIGKDEIFKESIIKKLKVVSIDESNEINKNFIKQTTKLLSNLFELSSQKDYFELMQENNLTNDVINPILFLFKAFDYIDINGSMENKIKTPKKQFKI